MPETETTTADGSGLTAGTKVAVYRGTHEGDANNVVAPAGLTLVTGSEDARTFTPVSNSAPVPVSDAGGSVTVDGTVAATQSGTWTLGANSGVDVGDVTINNASGASAVNIQDGGNTITVDGTVAVTNVATVGTSVTPGTSAAHLGKAIDSPAGATDTGVAMLAIRDDALSALTPAETDYVPLRVGSTGGLHTIVGNTVTVTGSVSTSGSAPSTATRSSHSSASNVTIAAANANRLALTIVNQASTALLVKYGATATTSDYDVLIDPRMNWKEPTGYTGRIDAIAESGTCAARSVEFTA